jgi:Type III restriction enzyme, res subunit
VFDGRLTAIQRKAARALLRQDIGVLVAPSGVGKTVIGAYLIAARSRSTLVLVHRQPLLDQWMAQLSMFLGLAPRAIGQIGAGKGRDSFWISPHLMTYSGVTVIVLVSLGVLAWTSTQTPRGEGGWATYQETVTTLALLRPNLAPERRGALPRGDLGLGRSRRRSHTRWRAEGHGEMRLPPPRGPRSRTWAASVTKVSVASRGPGACRSRAGTKSNCSRVRWKRKWASRVRARRYRSRRVVVSVASRSARKSA